MGVHSRNTWQNMASYSAKSWVTFDEEEVAKNDTKNCQSDPWPISGVNDHQSSSNILSGSLYSSSSGSSLMSTSSLDSRGMSPTWDPEDTSRYLAFQALQHPAPAQHEEDTPEPYSSSSASSSDSKYSVFTSLRECEEKGEYLGWSKKVLGEGSMGWSETLRAKPAF